MPWTLRIYIRRSGSDFTYDLTTTSHTLLPREAPPVLCPTDVCCPGCRCLATDLHADKISDLLPQPWEAGSRRDLWTSSTPNLSRTCVRTRHRSHILEWFVCFRGYLSREISVTNKKKRKNEMNQEKVFRKNDINLLSPGILSLNITKGKLSLRNSNLDRHSRPGNKSNSRIQSSNQREIG